MDYNIDVILNLSPYLVILTPCCSIGERTISLVPLERANRRWNRLFENENYKNDMTLLNFPHSPDEWEKLDEEVTLTGKKDSLYAYDNLFFYFPTNDDALSKYQVIIEKIKENLINSKLDFMS